MSTSIFVSYAHESGTFRSQVKKLVSSLKTKNINVVSDFDHEDAPPELGWQTWMHQGIEDADVVLVVCSPLLIKRYHKREQPELGLGATYEGAIVLQYIYDAAQRNTKFYPILPDNGSITDIPTILKPFYNGFTFPSDIDRIYRMVVSTQKRNLDIQAGEEYVFAPGKISGEYDSRIMPTEKSVFGRDEELLQIIEFLNTTDPSRGNVCHVVGVGGVGKTELCKAALRRWLSEDSTHNAYYIDVPDNADEAELISRIGELHGRREALYFEEIAVLLRPSLYYLDNLESIAELRAGRELIRAICNVPGIRVLASSRVDLPKHLGKPIRLRELCHIASKELFCSAWKGDDLSEQDKDVIEKFVSKELGGHALTISITARLGECYSLSALIERWNDLEKLNISDYVDGFSREENLDLSLGITANALIKTKGALHLWTFASLFPKGVPENIVANFELRAEIPSAARQALTRHNILFFRESNFYMLPPIARFALDRAKREKEGFSWTAIREFVLSNISSENGNSIESTSAMRMLELESERSASAIDFTKASNEFFANCSHELQTPITIMAGYLEMLSGNSMEQLPNSIKTRAFDELSKQCSRIEKMTKKFLNLAFINHIPPDSELEWFSLDELMQTVMDEAIFASKSEHDFSYPNRTFLALFLDVEEFHTAFHELVINAIENTPADGKIDVQISAQEDNNLNIAIIDNGIGIADKYMNRLTEPFFRVSLTDRSRLNGNSGLGLTLVNEFCNKNNLELVIQSTEGEGSIFSMVIPGNKVRLMDK